jgi:hypothetical protein
LKLILLKNNSKSQTISPSSRRTSLHWK